MIIERLEMVEGLDTRNIYSLKNCGQNRVRTQTQSQTTRTVVVVVVAAGTQL